MCCIQSDNIKFNSRGSKIDTNANIPMRKGENKTTRIGFIDTPEKEVAAKEV